jgi:plastocyanin
MALRTFRPAATTTAAVVAALTLAGCGSSSYGTASSAQSTPPAASPPASSPAATGAPVNPTPVAVTATENEFSITLSQTTFKPGAYTFTVVNQGQAPHNLAIKGPGIEPEAMSTTIQNGATTPLTVTLQPGSYELWCTVDSHKGKGMDMTIQVG